VDPEGEQYLPDLMERAQDAMAAAPIADEGEGAGAQIPRRAPKRCRDPANPGAAPTKRPRRALAQAEYMWLCTMFDAVNPAGCQLSNTQLEEIRQVGLTTDPPMLSRSCKEEHVRSAQRTWRGVKAKEQARAVALAQGNLD
jgi:hypothetical protein